MDAVRGDFLGLPHGITPAEITANDNWSVDPLRAVNALYEGGGSFCGFGTDVNKGDSGLHKQQAFEDFFCKKIAIFHHENMSV